MSSHIARKDPCRSPDCGTGPLLRSRRRFTADDQASSACPSIAGACVTRTTGTRPISIRGGPRGLGRGEQHEGDETRRHHGGSFVYGRTVMSNVIRNLFATLTTLATDGGSIPMSRRRHSTSPRAWIPAPGLIYTNMTWLSRLVMLLRMAYV